MDNAQLAAMAHVSDADLLRGMTCDHCAQPAVRWFKSTGVRLCDQQSCFDFFAAERKTQPRKQ